MNQNNKTRNNMSKRNDQIEYLKKLYISRHRARGRRESGGIKQGLVYTTFCKQLEVEQKRISNIYDMEAIHYKNIYKNGK